MTVYLSKMAATMVGPIPEDMTEKDDNLQNEKKKKNSARMRARG